MSRADGVSSNPSWQATSVIAAVGWLQGWLREERIAAVRHLT